MTALFKILQQNIGYSKPETSMKKVQFKVHIAVDFGTDGCALAFAYNNEVIVYNKWKAKKRQRAVKAKTQILLNDKDEVVAFGDNAKTIYSNLTGKERMTWKYFDRFKMALYDEEYNQLTSINGLKCDANIVFVAAFQHLEGIALEYLKKITNENIKKQQIQWILTVPAIWSEKAKYKLKSWIIAAKLVDKQIKNQCKIVYEPDCAALAIREDIQQNKLDIEEKHELNKGDRYILIDAGGGTVDIVCHKVNDKSIEEIECPSGGKWGGCFIDDQFIELLEKIFGKKLIDEYKKWSPNVYREMIDNFQNTKATFYQNESVQYYPVEMPYEFVQYLRDKCDVEQKINSYNNANNSSSNEEKKSDDDHMDANADNTIDMISMEEETIILGKNTMKALFDIMIQKIISHISKLLNHSKYKYKYLYLAGGLSCSPYFQQRMKQIFTNESSYAVTVIVPENPILSVVRGAAYFGFKKNRKYISARIMKYTYGIYVIQHAYGDSLKEGFSVVVHKGDRIAFNEKKPRQLFQNTWEQQTVLPILRSNLVDPTSKQDGTEIAKITISTIGILNKITTEFCFYGTMLTVYAYNKRTPNEKQKIEIEYS